MKHFVEKTYNEEMEYDVFFWLKNLILDLTLVS